MVRPIQNRNVRHRIIARLIRPHRPSGVHASRRSTRASISFAALFRDIKIAASPSSNDGGRRSVRRENDALVHQSLVAALIIWRIVMNPENNDTTPTINMVWPRGSSTRGRK